MAKNAKAALCIVAGVAFVVAVLPRTTGISVHEWIGLVALAVLLAHVAASLDALAGLACAVRKGSLLAAARIALDVALFIALAICVVSGALISATVLPTFGLVAPGYFLWDPLHAASAKVLLTLVLVHAVGHAGKLVRILKAR